MVRGVMRFAIEIQPRFGYGRTPHQVDLSECGGVFASEGLELTVRGIAPEGTSVKDLGITLERDGGRLRWTRTLREGEIGGVVLESMGAPRAGSRPGRRSSWRTTRRGSGARGCTGLPTPAGGRRWSPAPP